MKNKPNHCKQKSGQSLLEFLLTLIGFFTVAFMFVQIAMGFGVANYIQYATFLSARSYLSGAKNIGAQKYAATGVLERMLYKNGEDRFKVLLKSAEDGGEPKGAMIGGPRLATVGSSDARFKNWEQGVTYKFNARLYMIPIIKPAGPGGNTVELESQAWLGREPTFEECAEYMLSKKGPSGSPRQSFKGAFIFDNGC